MITRRQFVQTSAAMVSCAGALPRFAVADESFLNGSPSHQTLPVEIAEILTRVTGFSFAPSLVSDVQGRHFAHVLRQEFGRIQDEAQSLSAGSNFNAYQLSWLEAFARAGSFCIRRTQNLVTLTVEV